MNEKVSIIVPVYNVEKYIDQCIESIFNQTYTNIEVIIVDDGSTDKSSYIIKKYAKKYNNIIYLTQENKGVSDARNLGLKYSTGKYIVFIDPDDYLNKNTIQLMYNKINEGYDIVIGGYTKVYDDNVHGNDIEIINKVDKNKLYTGCRVAELMLRGKISGYLWDKMFKRELLLDEKFNFESGRYIEDWYPVFKQIYRSKNIGFIDTSIYNYRQRKGSTVYKKNEKLLIDYMHATSNIIEYAKYNKMDEKSIDIFIASTFCGIVNMYTNLNIDQNFKIYNKFKKSIYNNYNIKIINIIKMSGLKNTTKVAIILWKLKLLHFIIKFRK